MCGYVIQNKAVHISKNINYHGVGRYGSFPMTDVGNMICKTLFDCPDGIFEIQDKQMNEYLDDLFNKTDTYLCNDTAILDQYIKKCRDSGLDLRILFLQTEKNFDDQIDGEFLGYDVIYQCEFFSGIYDDLFENIPEPMENDSKKLNKYGLFDNYNDAVQFKQNMDRCVSLGYDIEPSMGFEIVKTFEVNI